MSAPLQPVSMKKGRQSLPRFSPKYDPDAPKHARYWRPEEDAVLRAHYPTGGGAACVLKLPGRTLQGVYGRAYALKLVKPHTNGRGKRKTPELTDELKAKILDAWPSLQGRSAVSDLAIRLGVERWWLSKQMVTLGLSMPHRIKEPAWSDAENALMREVPLHDPAACARIFRSRGFKRTATAIMVRAKRMEISRRFKGGLSAGQAAKLLGIDCKTMTSRCIRGNIEATRRGTRRLPQQGGDAWVITLPVLRKWVLDNLEYVDIRKVDKFEFVALLVGRSELAA